MSHPGLMLGIKKKKEGWGQLVDVLHQKLQLQ